MTETYALMTQHKPKQDKAPTDNHVGDNMSSGQGWRVLRIPAMIYYTFHT